MAILFLGLPLPAPDAAAPKGGQKASSSANASWHARISGNDASPARLIAVDKNQQTLFLFEKHSPLRLAGKFSCTTGQMTGDKFVEGDLKTPEGIYFVLRRLTGGLSFEKYGYEAYTLNYPNPVDKLRRKTGYGIWIHGRGVPITPNLTEGCVALNNTDLAMLGKNLVPGTPVALAAAVNFSPAPTPEDKAVIDTLHRKTYDWAKAWSGKSKKFFDYYDADAYSVAQGESFAAFKNQKERVFKTVAKIDTKISNVQALQGPGYWVTWFQQDYNASNLSTKGVRWLYWQKDNKGELRIVGMEWAPHLSDTLTAGLSGAPGGSGNLDAQQSVAALAPPAAPPAPAAPQPASPAAQPVAAPAKAEQPAAKPEKPVSVAMADTAPKAPAAPKAPSIAEVGPFIEAWRRAWEKADLTAYMACYAPDAVQGERSGSAAIRDHKVKLWRGNGPKQVVLTNIRITSKQDSVTADMHQSYTNSSSFADMGVKTLTLRAKNGVWRIVREDWSPLQ